MGPGRGRGHTSTDALHTATASQAADSGLGDTLDVVAEDLAVAFCAAFAKTFSAFTT